MSYLLQINRAAALRTTHSSRTSRSSGGPNDESEAVTVRTFGCASLYFIWPDIFLTMTCNTNWPEVRRSFLPGQSPQDRQTFGARVFNLKLKALMEAAIKDKIFGEVWHMSGVIEFQKRGLPHAHCIFILDQASNMHFEIQRE